MGAHSLFVFGQYPNEQILSRSFENFGIFHKNMKRQLYFYTLKEFEGIHGHINDFVRSFSAYQSLISNLEFKSLFGLWQKFFGP